MARRSRDLIVAEILEICMEGALKTHIIYKANLNFQKASKYLEQMEEQGLLSHIYKDSKMLYMTTEKGRDLYYMLKKVQNKMWNAHHILVGDKSNNMII